MHLSLVFLAASTGLILTTSSTYAQATPPAATAPAAPAATTPTGGKAADGKAADGTVKAIRQACRQEADAGKLKGEARMKAVSACVVTKRPDLAQREQCRMDGRQKGLRNDELKSFIKDCVKGKG